LEIKKCAQNPTRIFHFLRFFSEMAGSDGHPPKKEDNGTLLSGKLLNDVATQRPLYEQLYAAFPDLRHKIVEQISAGNKVVTRWTARGTPTGRQRSRYR
jgi:hypothetical protein